MKSVFIVKEEQIFEYSHWTEKTGYFVNKIKVGSDKKEKQKLAKQNAYKLSFWQRLKFFGLSLLPQKRQQYEIISLKKGYDIRKV